MLRRLRLAVAVASAVFIVGATSPARAQFLGGAGGVDPFSLYFGYYLPHQAYVAAQPTPLDTINQITAQRQFNAVTDRAGLYDPISPFGEEELDPLRPYSGSGSTRKERLAKPHNFSVTTNARGTGPALYYNRTARYFPHVRAGYGPNKNIAVTRGRTGGGGGFGGGFGGFGGGFPSPGPR
jgi:hypothetical protein